MSKHGRICFSNRPVYQSLTQVRWPTTKLWTEVRYVAVWVTPAGTASLWCGEETPVDENGWYSHCFILRGGEIRRWLTIRFPSVKAVRVITLLSWRGWPGCMPFLMALDCLDSILVEMLVNLAKTIQLNIKTRFCKHTCTGRWIDQIALHVNVVGCCLHQPYYSKCIFCVYVVTHSPFPSPLLPCVKRKV